MNESEKMSKETDQQLKIQCVDFATRVINYAEYFEEAKAKGKDQGDTLIDVSKKIYKFVTS